MKSALVISWRLNKRLIELEDETEGQTIGVVRRSGGARYVRWLGFIDPATAKSLKDARPVKLVAESVGTRRDIGTDWRPVPEGRFVQGCLVDRGVYAVAETVARII